MIDVTLSSPCEIAPADWRALCARAEANVFMDPAALAAAAAESFAEPCVLAAWDVNKDSRRLVGLWALNRHRPLPLFPKLLEGLPFYYAFNATPVIEPQCAHDVSEAFLATIMRDRNLPKVISVKSLDLESVAGAAIMDAVSRHGRHAILHQSERPYVTREAGVKNSGSTRKKLRQDWNRLAAAGAVDVVNDRAADDVARAFESFLALEHASWKGEQGTSLLSSARDARFVRQLVTGLARAGQASVGLLRVDRRPIAAQVMLYCGGTAYTWKTAFDAGFGKFSPGALLVDKMTELVFADPEMRAIDSCAVEDSFMGRLWSGRRRMIDLVVDVGETPSLAFALEVRRERAFDVLRDWRGRLQAARQATPAKPASSAKNAA